MIMDSRLELCNATALNTGGADNYLIGSQIDLSVERDIGNAGKPLWLVILVTTAVDSAADNTVQRFQLRSDASAAVDPDTGTVHLDTGEIAQASLTAGAMFAYPLPIEGNAYERYLGLVQITSVAAATAGAIDAFLTFDPPVHKIYPDGAN